LDRPLIRRRQFAAKIQNIAIETNGDIQMNKIIVATLSAFLAVAASPAFAATSDLMSTYWLGR